MKTPDMSKIAAAIKEFEKALEETFTDVLESGNELDNVLDVHLHDTLSQAVQEYIIEVETLLQRTDGGERLKAVYDAMNENDAITAKNAILSLQKKGDNDDESR